VRELQNVIERAVILCADGEELQAAHLGLVSRGGEEPAAGNDASDAAELVQLAEIEKRHILRVLDRCDGNRTHAARHLGISIRTLRNKLHEYGVKGRDDREPETLAAR
jgi:DNA-binding NtrC family response regulator